MKIDLMEEMKKQGFKYETLSNKVGCSKGLLTKFFTTDEIIKFDIVLRTIKLILPEKEIEYMVDFCRMSDKPRHLKCALEYADIHSNSELLNELINKCKNHRNKEIREYARFYELLHDRLVKDKSIVDVYREISSYTPLSQELKVLKSIIEMNYFYKIKHLKSINNLTGKVLSLIDEMELGFIRDSYRARYNQMEAYVQLHIYCNPEEARKIAVEAIESGFGHHMNGFFNNIIATSYFYESQEKMNLYAKQTINEYAYIYDRNDDVIQGIVNRYKKLNMIMEDNMIEDYVPDAQDPIDLYIEGVRQNDNYKLIQCLVEIHKRGNIFFSHMVVQKLKEYNCDEALINSIQTI